MSEQQTVFGEGFILKAPHANAKDFVKGSLSIKVDEAIKFLQEHKDDRGWVNLDLLEGKSGKWYTKKNTWQPEKKEEAADEVTPQDVPW